MGLWLNTIISTIKEASFGQLVDRNGVEVLRWMNEVGAITPTQYQSAFDSKGNITAEAKNDLMKVLYQAVFKGANQQLEELFDKLPAKAQRAILSTAFRDLDSPFSQRMLGEIQASIRAYSELMKDPNFAGTKKLEEVLRAVEEWTHQQVLDDRFEQVVPADNYSNFALRLAAMYKASDYSQKTIATTFNDMYDLIQGTVKPDLFNPEPDTTPRTLVDAIKERLGIEYEPAKNGLDNGRNGSTDVAVDDRAGTGGERGSSEPPASGESSEGGEGTAERGAGAADDSGDKTSSVAGIGDRAINEWFGPVYTEFEGKGVEAEKYLRDKCEGVAKGALSYPGLSPIDLAWGDMKSGYMKIVIKHPEVVGKLQSILNDCEIKEQSDNRVILESDTHKVIVSKMKGSTPTDNWLLTAYEKKKKPVSASSSDIETEPEGKRNGTATPQSELYLDGKGNESLSKEQITGEKSSSPVEGESEQAIVQKAKPSKGDFFVSKRTGDVVYVGQITESGKYRLFGEDTASVKTLSDLYEIFRPATEDDIASSDWAAKTWKSMRETPSDWGLEGEGNSVQSAVEAASVEVDSNPSEAQTTKGEGYTIAPKPYTNKQGKILDTYLVSFDRDFSKEEMSALRAKARAVKGWYNRESGGYNPMGSKIGAQANLHDRESQPVQRHLPRLERHRKWRATMHMGRMFQQRRLGRYVSSPCRGKQKAQTIPKKHLKNHPIMRILMRTTLINIY